MYLYSSSRNDILRKHGVIPEKPPDPEPIIQEALVEAERKAHQNRLEDKDLDELDELEDEEDEEFLEQYRYLPSQCQHPRQATKIDIESHRKKRLAELTTHQKTSIYNAVYPLQKPDYAREVTETSHRSFVLVHLASAHGSGNVESRILAELWRQLAAKLGDIKFCEIRADLCIEGYPEKNTPTILVYHDGDIVKQFVTLRELNGPRTRVEGGSLPLIYTGCGANCGRY